MGFRTNVLFVAHTDTDPWSVSFTRQQTDTQTDRNFALARKRCLTLPIRAEYIYSVASHASRPDRVLILRNFRKALK
jgi:hypothetical protein